MRKDLYISHRLVQNGIDSVSTFSRRVQFRCFWRSVAIDSRLFLYGIPSFQLASPSRRAFALSLDEAVRFSPSLLSPSFSSHVVPQLRG
jgi:hypothetical protein